MVRLDEEEVGTQEVREHHQSSENPKATSSFLELRNSSNLSLISMWSRKNASSRTFSALSPLTIFSLSESHCCELFYF